MNKKYAGQGHYELGQNAVPNHQDQPIGGGLGEAMNKKYAGQGHYELG